MTPFEFVDPAVYDPKETRRPAARGDIAVAFDRFGTGAYYVGQVSRVDVAGGIEELNVGGFRVLTRGMRCNVTRSANFHHTVSAAFGRYASGQAAEAALRQHIHPKANWSK